MNASLLSAIPLRPSTWEPVSEPGSDRAVESRKALPGLFHNSSKKAVAVQPMTPETMIEGPVTENQIRDLASLLYFHAGQPSGGGQECWLSARRLLSARVSKK